MAQDPVIPGYLDQQNNRAAGQVQQVADDWTQQLVYSGRTAPQATQKVEVSPGSGIYRDVTVGPGNAQPGQAVPEWISAGQLANEWFTMDAVTRNRYKDTFILLGLINPQRATDQDYSSIWTSYAKQLASYNAANNGTQITIGDLLDADIRRKEQTDPTFSDMMKTGKRTTTRTSTNIQKSSSLDARALMDAAARSLLGRKATDEESAKMLAAVNQLESANPEVTTTTQEEDIYGQVLSQNSTTSGGVSAAARQQLAQEQAQANPEYGAYQAATTYMGSLMDMVYGKGY